MEYLLLIYADELQVPKYCDPNESAAFETLLSEYRAFSKSVQDAGVMLGGNPLQSVETATTVRVRDGKTQTSDGPFAETKEQLAGYYLLDCESKEEALAHAARIPGAKWGSVEVRPIMKFD